MQSGGGGCEANLVIWYPPPDTPGSPVRAKEKKRLSHFLFLLLSASPPPRAMNFERSVPKGFPEIPTRAGLSSDVEKEEKRVTNDPLRTRHSEKPSQLSLPFSRLLHR